MIIFTSLAIPGDEGGTLRRNSKAHDGLRVESAAWNHKTKRIPWSNLETTETGNRIAAKRKTDDKQSIKETVGRSRVTEEGIQSQVKEEKGRIPIILLLFYVSFSKTFLVFISRKWRAKDNLDNLSIDLHTSSSINL